MSQQLEVDSGSNDQQRKMKSHESFGSIFDTEKNRIYLTAKFEKYKDRISLDTLRPLPAFVGINNVGGAFCLAPDAFSPPSKKMDKNTAEKFKQRVSLNMAFFLTNYAVIAFGTFIVVVLLHPKMIIYSAIVYAMWKTHNVMVRDNIPMVIGGEDIGQYLTVEIRTKILYLLTLWVVIMYCLKPFLSAFIISAVIITCHAILRDPKQVESNRTKTIHSTYKDSDSDDENNSSGSEVMVEKMDTV